MLVCSVSARARRIITADIPVEAATAIDAPSRNATSLQLVDDPASGRDVVDAYSGELLFEAANAVAVVDVPQVYSVAVAEGLTANSTQDATVPAAVSTWNPADKVNTTLTNGNLTATNPSGIGGVRGTASHTSGKHYWEYKVAGLASNGMAWGVALSSANLSSGLLTGTAAMNRLGTIFVNGTSTAVSLGTRGLNDVTGVAVDFTASLIWFRVAPSGLWNNNASANPATGAGGFSISVLSGALFPVFTNGQAGDAVTANFGATAFTGSVPSGFTSGF